MFRRALTFVCALVFAACTSHQGRPGTAAPVALPRAEVTVVRDVTYTPPGWAQALSADLYEPSGAGPFPAVLMIHGGGWERRTRADMDNIAMEVAQRGYVVMNASYRFAPAARFPAQLKDMQQAVLWLRANAAAHDIRADRIGVWGYSAGAHLATLVAYTGPGDTHFVAGARVQAVVAGGTPVDLSYYPNSRLILGLMGESVDQNPQLWRDASPITLVTRDDAPTFLYHGTFDILVGVKNARAMYQALQTAGVQAELYQIRGLEHAMTFHIDAPVRRGIEFLDRNLRSK
jgi:acetyl esterase/lipase